MAIQVHENADSREDMAGTTASARGQVNRCRTHSIHRRFARGHSSVSDGGTVLPMLRIVTALQKENHSDRFEFNAKVMRDVCPGGR
jgi:hypothetical protein